MQTLPKHVRDSFLAAEDADFYQHDGLDYFGIVRSALKTLRPGGMKSGASTISQQACRRLLLSQERTFARVKSVDDETGFALLDVIGSEARLDFNTLQWARRPGAKPPLKVSQEEEEQSGKPATRESSRPASARRFYGHEAWARVAGQC